MSSTSKDQKEQNSLLPTYMTTIMGRIKALTK